MASAMFLGIRGDSGGTMELPPPESRGRMNINHFHILERQLLPTDPQGISTLTASNILPGSEVRLFFDDNSEIAGGIESLSGTDTVVFQYNYYTIAKLAYLVILLPGYHPLRMPFQLNKTALTYTVYQIPDPNYLP